MTVIGGLSPTSAILNDCGISRFSPSTQNVAPPSIVIFALFIFKNFIRFDEYSFENPTKKRPEIREEKFDKSKEFIVLRRGDRQKVNPARFFCKRG